MISKFWKLGGAAMALALAVTAPVKAEDYKVIIMQALTGPGAFAGTDAAAGMKFAAEEINKTGFLGAGNKVVYEVADDASDRAQTITLVSRYASDPKVLSILGPTIAPTVAVATPIATERKIPIHPLTNSVATRGPYTFISSQPAQVTMPLLAEYAFSKLNVKRCASVYLADNSAYVELNDVMTGELKKKGVTIITPVGVKSTDNDFSALSTRIVGENVDCVLVLTQAPLAGNLIAQLKTAGLSSKAKIIGHTGMATPELVQFGGAAVEGVLLNADWAPGGAFPRAKAFDEAFKKETGRDANNFSAMGHSLMYVFANAVKNTMPNPTREAIRDQYANEKDIPVVMGTGLYSRDAESIPHTGLVILEVKGGKFQLLGTQ